MTDIQDKNEALKKSREVSKNWGWAVYIGGIAVAWAFALAFFVAAFKGNLFLQIIVSVGVTFVSVNAIVLANGLHHYAVNGWHRVMGIILYAADLLLMIANVLVSAGELTGSMPDWAKAYEPYAYSTIVIPVITWGVLWILDPHHTADVKTQAAKDRFNLKVIKAAEDMIDSPEGQKIIKDVASNMARNQLMDPTLLIGAGSITTSDTGTAAEVLPVSLKQVQALLETHGLNGNSNHVAKELLKMVDPTLASIKQK